MGEIFIFRILAVSLDSIKKRKKVGFHQNRVCKDQKKRQERHFAGASKGTLDFPNFSDREQFSVGNNLAPVARRTPALSVNERLSRKTTWLSTTSRQARSFR